MGIVDALPGESAALGSVGRRWSRRGGVPVRARFLHMRPTRVFQDHGPVLDTVLRIHPPDGTAPFDAARRLTVPMNRLAVLHRTRDVVLYARPVRAGRVTDSPATCHGLAGNAEFLPDAAARTGDGSHAAAELLVEHLAAQAVLRDGRLLVPDENRRSVLAEYATGLAGSLSLLLLMRMRCGSPRAWLPEGGPAHP
ncbi:hypothetical protein ACFXGT_13475 [Streptomyces sp. NPDC059352]|uniref:hypothetical protein n=1 Tax=Streptomyces sp. NPDC059352 TaxID=3346810 RepID=UPI0036C04353